MLFFIPARRGSNRVPHKNTRIVGGQPLIKWTFDYIEAMGSAVSKATIVSTDDPDVVELARPFGFQILSRPDRLCDDKSKMNDVLTYHLDDFKRLPGGDSVCVLYPTSPLRNMGHIIAAIETWVKTKNTDASLMSVSPVFHRPFGLMEIEKGMLRCLHSDGMKHYQAQGQPTAYRANGAIYILPRRLIEAGLVNSQLFTPSTIPFVMDEISGLEVDTDDDLKIVDMYLRELTDEEEPREMVEFVIPKNGYRE